MTQAASEKQPHPSNRSVLIFAIFTLFLVFAPLRAAVEQSTVVDGIKITVGIAGETSPHFGFIPVRVIIDNRQPRELQWEAKFHSESYWTGQPLAGSWSTTFVVAAGRTSERWLIVPSIEAGLLNRPGFYGMWGNLSATFSGTGIRATTLHVGTRGSGAINQMVPWAVSSALQAGVRAQLAAFQSRQPAPAPPGRRRMPTAFSSDLATVDFMQPLGDWRIWAPYARVVLSEAEFALMPSPNRTALRSWVALGGTLYLVPAARTAETPPERFGLGTIVKYDKPILTDTSGETGTLFESASVLGTTLAMPSANDMSLQKSGLSARLPAGKRVGDWMVYFFVGFALLVGPINLFAIAPVKRRQRLFLTVPAISIGAAALLVVAIWLQDGVGGDGARRALVVLLPGDNQAAVFQEQVSRSGLLFGTSFNLASDTVCATVPTDDNPQTDRSFSFERQENRAGGDWFRSRARQAQHLRRLTPTRARIELIGTAADGAPIVQSSIGVTLRGFSMTSATGKWQAREVPPGTRVTLSRAPAGAAVGRRIAQFGGMGTVHFENLVRHCGATELGHFVANAGDSELAPIATLPGIRWDDSVVLITGVVENAGGASRTSP